MTMAPSVWDERADRYRRSEAHRTGADLDLMMDLCEGGPGVSALDVATGGGHVADRLRALGCEVTTTDASEAMRPDVVCDAASLPLEDSAFAIVASRYATHHFPDISAAIGEMARVSSDRVVVVDTLYQDDAVEQAELIRDADHVRNYSEAEWRALFVAAGLRVDSATTMDKWMDLDAWLARTGCGGADADAVRRLVATRTRDTEWNLPVIVIRGRTG
ncbi:MAG: class I SAM-dependent methyltransferase [Gaiellaceae bacterium]